MCQARGRPLPPVWDQEPVSISKPILLHNCDSHTWAFSGCLLPVEGTVILAGPVMQLASEGARPLLVSPVCGSDVCSCEISILPWLMRLFPGCRGASPGFTRSSSRALPSLALVAGWSPAWKSLSSGPGISAPVENQPGTRANPAYS